MAQWRVFLGLWLPSVLLEPLIKVQTYLRSQQLAVRWTKPENFHITLHFLGNIPVERIPQLQTAFAANLVGLAAPTLCIDQLGAFPKPERPSVLWAGFSSPDPALEALNRAATAAGQHIGIPPEDRPYHPHVTLGYVERDATFSQRQACAQAIDYAWPGTSSAIATQVAIIRSESLPDGVRYTSIAEMKAL